jgi:isopentenyl phosphate kinase
MNSEEIDIIKLGGSVITDKTNYKTLNKKALQDLVKILSMWNKKCIVVHGAGSFGHVIAEKYAIISGYQNEEQLEGLSQIRNDMNELNLKILETFREEGVKVFDFQTSSLVYQGDKQNLIFLSPVKKALDLGLLPVLAGDILFSDDTSFTIFSGDSLIELLAQNLSVDRVIFLTDVDGLMIKDPISDSVRLLESANFEEFTTIEPADYISQEISDVTGGMVGKINTIKTVLNYANEIIIANGNHPERFQRILKKKKPICTSIAGKKSTKR